jgi:hypothetical protein
LQRLLVAVAQSACQGGEASVLDQALAAAEQALGGGSRAQAALRSLAAVLAYMEAELPKDSSVLDEENLATAAAHRAVQPALAERLQQRIDAFEAQTAGAARCPLQACDGKGHSRGRAQRSFLGRHGRLTVSVRQSVCQKPGCGHTFSPACDHLGLGSGRFTPGCADVVTMMATTVPHGKAVTLLGEMLQIEVSEHAVQDLVEARGEALLALDQTAAQFHLPCDDNGLERDCGRPADAVAAKEAPEVAYLEVDGVLPMTRELQPELSTEQPGARGGKGRRYKLEGKEVKNAVL